MQATRGPCRRSKIAEPSHEVQDPRRSSEPIGLFIGTCEVCVIPVVAFVGLIRSQVHSVPAVAPGDTVFSLSRAMVIAINIQF